MAAQGDRMSQSVFEDSLPVYEHPATFEEVRAAMGTIGIHVYDTGHFRRFTNEEHDEMQEKARAIWDANGRVGYWNDYRNLLDAQLIRMQEQDACSLENPESCEACQ